MLELRSRAYGDVVERTPAEALLAASGSLDATLQRLEALAGQDGGADPVLLREIRSAAAESARVAKLVQDAGLDERRLQLAEAEQTDLAAVLGLVLEAYGLTAAGPEVRLAVAEAVERVRSGDRSSLPSRVEVPVEIEGPADVEAEEKP